MAHTNAHAVGVILCAGRGARMGAAQNKVFLPLAGESLLTYSARAFAASPAIDELLFVAHPDEIERVRREVVQHGGLTKTRDIIAGGATRHQSEERALASLRPDIEAGRVDVLLIHDAARPFVRVADIEALVVAAREHRAALLAAPVGADEVIARVSDDGEIVATFASAELYRAQTPQAFDATLLLAVYAQARAAGFEGTDTASSVERAGVAVRVVAGPGANFKVTTAQDLARAETLLRIARPSTGS
ncbi:MAG TPA: 2-C-methyl-D-erythritol 4-phosphate cytidylyltransferase [Ktedonobacterales bacterium]|nr:2-C-methyl-D-erythritol 4-phosphate cytidylyltransferase [Ktedonobacterales bacterium]